MVSTTHRIRDRTLAVGLGLLLLWVALELGLRLAGVFYDEPRATAPPAQGTASAKHTILVVGDSMTWGIGATQGMTWPEQLERKLDERAHESDFTVINGAMAGANSTMVRTLLDEYLLTTRPEIVVILAGGSNNTNYYGFHRWLGDHSLFARMDDRLYGLRTYRLVRYLGRTGLNPAVGGQDPVLDGFGGGLEAYQRWLDETDHPALPAFDSGAAVLRSGRFEQAREHFEAAVHAHPDSPRLHWGLGMAHRGLRDNPAAHHAFERCVQLEPTNPACPFGLGEMYMEGLPQDAAGQPNLLTAEHWFYRGVEASPAFAANHGGQGMVFARSQRQSQALDAFMRCAERSPDDTRCYPSMAVTAEQAGRGAELRPFLKGLAKRSSVAADQLDALEHDVAEEQVLAWVRTDLEAMIDSAQAAGAQVVLAGYPYHNNTNALAAALATERALPFADTHSLFQGDLATGTTRRELFIADDAHCTDRGYGLMAQAVHQALLTSTIVPR